MDHFKESPDLYQIFEKYGEEHFFRKGELVYIQNDSADFFYLVKSGMLRSYIMSADGREITVELINSGRIFAFVSFFTGINRIASVVALTNARVISLTHETVRQCFGEHYNLTVEMFRTLGHTTRFLVSQIENLMIISAEKRIAHVLVQLALEFKQPGQTTYTIPYTHQQFAEIAGMNRVTATKELNNLSNRGWIELGYRKILVKNEAALQSFYLSTDR